MRGYRKIVGVIALVAAICLWIVGMITPPYLPISVWETLIAVGLILLSVYLYAGSWVLPIGMAVAGVLMPIVAYHLAKVLRRPSNIDDAFMVSFIPILLLGSLAGYRLRTQTYAAFSTALASYLSVVFGVVAAAMVEELLIRQRFHAAYEEHNLWFMEIVYWRVFAAIPMVLGLLIGLGVSVLKTRKKALTA